VISNKFQEYGSQSPPYTGVYKDMPNEIYQQSDALSRSDLWKSRRSPAHYKASKNAPHISTPAMEFGSMVHKLILETDKFEKTYVLEPTDKAGKRISKATKVGKALWQEWSEAHPGKIGMSSENLAACHAMKDAIFATSHGCHLLSNGYAEVSMFADGVYPFPVKIRPDFINEDGVLVDLNS